MKPPPQPRVAVIGVGTMGSQVLHQLASRGVPVTGFEQFDVGHGRGAAGGETRIFRIAYKEGGGYVPLLREARQAWERLGAQAGTPLLTPCGALTIGSAQDPDVRTVLGVAQEWGLDVERLDRRQTEQRFPQHRLFDDDVVLLDREGGLLDPHRAVVATARLAQQAGAAIHTRTTVVDVVQTGTGVAVHHRAGGDVEVTRFDQVVLCTGPWIARSVPRLAGEVEIRRAVLCWFDAGAEWAPERFPVGIRRSGAENSFSFFPDVGGGVKVNLHVRKSPVADPDRLDPVVEPDYASRVSAAVARCLPGLPDRPTATRTYMDGYTADNHGIIGRDPDRPDVLVMGGFSGHGFKLAPVFARSAADLLLTGRTGIPIDHLSLSRLS
ncbi:N-methyl-L-tryptophan oxidase [Streptomyces reniochalinae]|uniref:N-methyl-L-tryptophan oxidase n=1 Tax=Streptomyces reniochalinae TaxID=2250578 RepID=A0A367ETW1_9ACTN|nr:N-methyl-L-tryptophan oxidase [Streptomyces reniochalinae]RCG21035.1 N-methyl-L-tryptophan oxidase [Streptomyces reniochalinae]